MENYIQVKEIREKEGRTMLQRRTPVHSPWNWGWIWLISMKSDICGKKKQWFIDLNGSCYLFLLLSRAQPRKHIWYLTEIKLIRIWWTRAKATQPKRLQALNNRRKGRCHKLNTVFHYQDMRGQPLLNGSCAVLYSPVAVPECKIQIIYWWLRAGIQLHILD